MKKILIIILLFSAYQAYADDFSKNDYAHRTMTYTTMGERVVIIENGSPRVTTLDPWLEQVYLLADGEHTIKETIQYVKNMYKNSLPKGIDDTIINVIKQLKSLGYVKITQKPYKLPYYLSIPQNKQDTEKSRKAMIAEGFITE